MYGPLILVNSALADSAWIEGGDTKDKKVGRQTRGRGSTGAPFIMLNKQLLALFCSFDQVKGAAMREKCSHKGGYAAMSGAGPKPG